MFGAAGRVRKRAQGLQRWMDVIIDMPNTGSGEAFVKRVEKLGGQRRFCTGTGCKYLLDQREPPLLARQPDEPLDALGDEHQRIDLGSVLSAQLDNHRQGAIGNERERVRRVDRDRRQHRKQPIDEQLLQPNTVVAGQRLVVENGNAFRVQPLLQIGPAALLPLNQPCGDFGDRGQLLVRGQSVLALHRNAARSQFLEGGDPHHVELVEVAVGDRQESHPLEQRMARIARLLEHPFVEGEPGQLTVDISLPRARRNRRCRFIWRQPVDRQF